MGSGSYSIPDRAMRSVSMGYDTKSTNEIFSERQINNAMNPYGVKIRESRDSIEHPESLAIILALDETGSMGSIPHYLVKTGLPHIMDSIIQHGIKNPQILFLGIGDHECDQAPLQVSQFESSDELLDHWLTKVFLEGGGGTNDGESYLLAWYFAAYHTSIDCFDKRKKKGFLFTIGDEPVLKNLPKNSLKKIMGDGQYENFSSAQLLAKAREKYVVKHLHLKQGANGSRQSVMDGWKQLMDEDLRIVEDKQMIADIIADCVSYNLAVIPDIKRENTEIIL